MGNRILLNNNRLHHLHHRFHQHQMYLSPILPLASTTIPPIKQPSNLLVWNSLIVLQSSHYFSFSFLLWLIVVYACVCVCVLFFVHTKFSSFHSTSIRNPLWSNIRLKNLLIYYWSSYSSQSQRDINLETIQDTSMSSVLFDFKIHLDLLVCFSLSLCKRPFWSFLFVLSHPSLSLILNLFIVCLCIDVGVYLCQMDKCAWTVIIVSRCTFVLCFLYRIKNKEYLENEIIPSKWSAVQRTRGGKRQNLNLIMVFISEDFRQSEVDRQVRRLRWFSM